VSLAFQNSQGNIDLQLFDAAHQLLGSSASTGNSEQLTQAVTAGQTYYVRVFGAGGAVNPNYSMTINVPEIPLPDSLEENDSFAAARSLAASDQTHGNLSIDAPNDDDFYSLVPTATGTLSVNLAFQNSDGNINLELYNSAQQLLASSASTANAEQLSSPVTAGQTYYIRVFGLSGATNSNYSMTIDPPEIPPGDVFENNDTFATARALAASNQTYTGLSIDAANDDDYYSLTPTVTGTLTVSLAFLNSQGDIDMELLSATQTRLGLSDSTGNAEQLSISITAGQTYVIRAFGFESAINPNYSMTVAIVQAPPSTDYYL
jgi:predicted RNA-binding protein with TRAM domain